jgi:hypothetical protein
VKAGHEDSISTLLGTSDPTAIGQFMVANHLSGPTIREGRSYVLATDSVSSEEATLMTSLGQSALDIGNAKLAARLQAQAAQVASAQSAAQRDLGYFFAAADRLDAASNSAVTAMGSGNAGGGGVGYYAGRVASGFGHAAVDFVTQPFLQLHDLGAIGYDIIDSVFLGNNSEPNFLSNIGKYEQSGQATSGGRLENLVGAIPILNLGVASYEGTTALMNGNYGGLAEQGGGLLFGAALGGATVRYGNYYLQSPLVPVGVGEMGAFGIKNVRSPLLAAEKGYPGIGTTPNGGPTFANTDYLYPAGEGQKSVVDLALSGNRRSDFAAANKAAGFAQTPKDYTWHHVDNFNPVTKMASLELVERGAHVATYPHSGSVAQYEQLFGVPYKR